MLKFKDNQKRLENEWEELKKRNPELVEIIEDLSYWVSENLKNDVIITMIFRTQEEQDNFYKDDPKYKIKPFKSPHQLYHAIDLRSINFKDSEITKIVNYLNSKWNSTNFYKWTALCHAIGSFGKHFHIQYCKK